VARSAASAGEPASTAYKALTKIKVRLDPDMSSRLLAEVQPQRVGQGLIRGALEEGEVFKVKDMKDADGQLFLKLVGQDGWVIAKGVAGEWKGKDIVSPAEDWEVTAAEVKKNVFVDEWDYTGFYLGSAVFALAIIVSIFNQDKLDAGYFD